ncbi:hypothetical protein DERP_003753, partial [Dermatophagoides pteronyssinus]
VKHYEMECSFLLCLKNNQYLKRVLKNYSADLWMMAHFVTDVTTPQQAKKRKKDAILSIYAASETS